MNTFVVAAMPVCKDAQSNVYQCRWMRKAFFIRKLILASVYRQLANDFLMEIWRSGQISLEQLLENGNFPFADSLLQSIKSQQEQIANGQQPQGLPPQLQQQIQQGTNMQAVQQGAQALYG